MSGTQMHATTPQNTHKCANLLQVYCKCIQADFKYLQLTRNPYSHLIASALHIFLCLLETPRHHQHWWSLLVHSPPSPVHCWLSWTCSMRAQFIIDDVLHILSHPYGLSMQLLGPVHLMHLQGQHSSLSSHICGWIPCNSSATTHTILN